MQIILLEKIGGLGNLGDIVTVKNGYARNFLIPSGKAKRATEANMQEFEARRAELEACEKRIAELEDTLRGIEEEFLLPENQRDAAALLAIQKRKDSAEEELADCYERWETLAD